MKPKILYIDPAHPYMEQELIALGYEIDKTNMTYSDLLPVAHQYTGYVVRSKFAIDKQLIDRSENLQFIARIGAGMENIDTEYAKTKNIHCLHSPEGNADAVAEFSIAQILNLLRHSQRANKEVKNGIWDRKNNMGFELSSQHIGIIGYGTMGKNIADKLSVFGCNILVHDKFKSNFGSKNIQEVSLQEIWEKADIVSLHINYLPENHHYVNESWLQSFHKNIYLINTSRGKILNTADLVQAIEKGKVKAAALDVLEYENIRLQNKAIEDWDNAMHYLAQSPKVILSPHIAGQTFEAMEKHARILVQKIKSEMLKIS